jgi:hypothetical protein
VKAREKGRFNSFSIILGDHRGVAIAPYLHCQKPFCLEDHSETPSFFICGKF